jgi:hypothetical protein
MQGVLLCAASVAVLVGLEVLVECSPPAGIGHQQGVVTYGRKDV